MSSSIRAELVRRVLVSASAAALVLVVAAPAAFSAGVAPAAAAASGDRWGYVWADQPSGGDYTPDLSYQRNSRGKVNFIQRDEGVGIYRVLFRRLWTMANDGTVSITDYGGGERTSCGLYLGVDDEPWYVVPHKTIAVEVFCRELPLVSADARFDITYAVRTTHKGRYAYLWADQPSSPSYTPVADHQYNSKGLTNTIAHNAIGRYAVHLPGVSSAMNGGTVKVTPEQHHLCNVSSWGDDDVEVVVNVRCFDYDGEPSNAHFSMTYANKVNLLGSGKGYGYAWADQPSSPSYTPNTFYSASKPGGDIIITRSSPGIYSVFFSGVGEEVLSDVQVTAYSNVANLCRVQGWGPGDGGQHIGVECYNTDGDPVDSRFTIQFIR